MPRRTFLKPWQEGVGTFRGLEYSKNEMAVVLSLANGQILKIFFPRASAEVQNILRELHGDMIGRKIGVMKLGDRNHRILIRTKFPEEEDH